MFVIWAEEGAGAGPDKDEDKAAGAGPDKERQAR
jgi:hypothetical protein